MQKNPVPNSEYNVNNQNKAIGAVALGLATLGFFFTRSRMRANNLSIIFERFNRGGFGVKLVKPREKLKHPKQNPNIRIASVERHPYTDPLSKEEVNGIHFHFGNSERARKRHRTFNYPFSLEEAKKLQRMNKEAPSNKPTFHR